MSRRSTGLLRDCNDIHKILQRSAYQGKPRWRQLVKAHRWWTWRNLKEALELSKKMGIK